MTVRKSQKHTMNEMGITVSAITYINFRCIQENFHISQLGSTKDYVRLRFSWQQLYRLLPLYLPENGEEVIQNNMYHLLFKNKTY